MSREDGLSENHIPFDQDKLDRIIAGQLAINRRRAAIDTLLSMLGGFVNSFKEGNGDCSVPLCRTSSGRVLRLSYVAWKGVSIVEWADLGTEIKLTAQELSLLDFLEVDAAFPLAFTRLVDMFVCIGKDRLTSFFTIFECYVQ